MMTVTMLDFVLCLALFSVGISAYKRGPPVDPDHPHLCEDMSPQHGHQAEPITDRPAPYRLTTSGQCFRQGSTLSVTLATTDNQTYFEGLFVMARRVSDNTTVNGQFDTNGDRQLQTLNCGHTGNSIGHSEDKHYMQKVFKWTADTNLTDSVYFIATVVHKKRQFWLGVTSLNLRYDPDCVLADSSSATPASSLLHIQVIVVSLLATGAGAVSRQLVVTPH